MAIAKTDHTTSQKPLRLWPGIAAAVLLCVVRFVIPSVLPEALLFGMIGALVGALAIVVWWLFFSRMPWSERVGAIVLMVVALFATQPLLHVSIATGGMGMLFFILAIPVLSISLVAGAVASRRLSAGLRRASIVAAILLACGVFTLLRTDGIRGSGSDLKWRWTKSPEERLLAQVGDEPLDSARDKPKALTPVPAATETPKEPLGARTIDKPLDSARGGPAALPLTPAAAKKDAEWPGFRGPNRDGIVRGVPIQTDLTASPPV